MPEHKSSHGGSKKIGRNKLKCQRYRLENRREKNKARRVAKEARRQERLKLRRRAKEATQ